MATPSYNCTSTLTECTIYFYKERTSFQADPLWLGLGFLFGLMVGALIAALCAIPCIRSWRKKKQQDEEEELMQKHGLTRQQLSQMRDRGDMQLGEIDRKADVGLIAAGAVSAYDEQDERRLSQKISRGKQGDEYPDEGDVLNEEEDLEEGNAGNRGLIDALVQSTGAGGDAELDDQDYREAIGLESSLRRQKNRMFHGALKNFMEKLLAGGKISEDLCDRVVQENKQNLTDIVRMLSEEKKQAEEDLKKDKKLASDPVALEREMEKLHPKFVQRWLSLLGEQESKIRHELRKELSEEEIDAVMQKLSEEMGKVERILGEERKRQADTLQERLMRRKQAQEKLRRTDTEIDKDCEAKIEDHRENLASLQQRTDLTDKQKQEILNEYERNVMKIKENRQADALQQQQNLAEKLKRQREKRLAKMSAQHSRDVQAALQGVDRATGTDAFIKDFAQLMEQQRSEKDELIEELDNVEAQQFNELKQRQHAEVQKDLYDEDQRLARDLERHVSPTDVSRYLRILEQQNEEYENRKASDRKRANAILKEKLAQRKAKQAETEKQSEVEEEALRAQQEATVQRVLNEQVDMSKESREKILKEHEQNMQQLNNQLQMSRLRQSKALELRLSKRKAQFAEKMAAKEPKKLLSEKEKEKLQQQQEAEQAAEEQRIAEERATALSELRSRLQQETQEALKEQDQRLGALIGRMQVGQARRKAIIQKQDQTIKELEEQLAARVAETGAPPTGQVDAILQRHYNQVEGLTEKLDEVKARQNQQLRDKLEAKRHRKAQELERQLDDDASRSESAMRSRAQAHFTAASTLMMNSMMEQRHRAAMQDLEREMEQELQKQKEQLDEQLNRELQEELQAQRTDFLAQLAAMSSLSKSEVDEVVQNAVADTGGDEHAAKKLAKDLRQGLKRAKTSIAEEEEYGRGRDPYGRDEPRRASQRDTYEDDSLFRRPRTSMAGAEEPMYEGRYDDRRRPAPRSAFEDDEPMY